MNRSLNPLVAGFLALALIGSFGSPALPVPGAPADKGSDDAPKIDPRHEQLVAAIRTGSEKERAAAAEELRKAGPAASAVAASLCELASRQDEDRHVDALFALEAVAPNLFGPVRTLTSSDDSAAEINAAVELSRMGVAARPATVVLRWHLARSKKHPPKGVPDTGRMLADLRALVRVTPEAREVLDALRENLDFKATDGSQPLRTDVVPLIVQVAVVAPEHRKEIAGIVIPLLEDKNLRRFVVPLLAQFAEAAPEYRAEIADKLAPLLDDKDLRLLAIAALPACAEVGARAKTKLNKVRLTDPSEEVKKVAEEAWKEVTAAEKAAARITDRSARGLAPQAFDAEDRWLRRLAREGLRTIHPGLEDYARRLGEDLLKETDASKHRAAVNDLKPTEAPPEAVAQVIIAYMTRAEKLPDTPRGFNEPNHRNSVVLQGVAARALIRLAPKEDETRKALLALSKRTARSTVKSYPDEAGVRGAMHEEEALWFGHELVVLFPGDKEVEQLLMNTVETVRNREVGYYAPWVPKHTNEFVQSLGELAKVKPESRPAVAELLGRVLNSPRTDRAGYAGILRFVEPETLANALIACGKDAKLIVVKARDGYDADRKSGQFLHDIEKAEQCIDLALAGLSKVKPEPVKPPADAADFGGKKYKFYPDVMAWREAKVKCELLGGRLAIPISQEQNDFLRKLVAAGKEEAWLGATDEAKEGTWVGVDGKPLTYLNWRKGQPANTRNEEHYLMLWKEGQWADQANVSIHYKPGFICEWIPETKDKSDSPK